MEYLTGSHIFNEHPKAQVAANLENHFVIILAANCQQSLFRVKNFTCSPIWLQFLPSKIRTPCSLSFCKRGKNLACERIKMKNSISTYDFLL